MRGSEMNELLRPYRKALLACGLIVVASSFVLLILWLGPEWLVADANGLPAADRVTALNNTRSALIQLVGAAGLFGSIVYAARTFGLTGRGQLADRYTKAIEQIARDEPRIIIGGVYALERIAQEDPGYAPVVVNVLAALVRERASSPVMAVSADVQAALTVLSHFGSGIGYLDLRNLHLRGVNLQNAAFRRVRLSGSDLTGANLVDVDFEGAAVWGISLPHADLPGANPREVSIDGAVLTGS